MTPDRKLLYCNVEFDTDLTSGRSSRQEQSCLEAQFYYLLCGSSGDKIILDAAGFDSYTSYLTRHGIAVPQQCSDSETLSEYDAFPWGWSVFAIDRFRHYQAKINHPQLESIRTVNSRRFCHRIARHYDLGVAGSRICESAEEARAAIDAFRSFPLVIKPEHGNAGIGFVRIASADQDVESDIDRLYSRAPTATVMEPWVHRVADISSRLLLDRNGRTAEVGYHRTLNNAAGVYYGNMMKPEDPLVTKWRDRLDAGTRIVSQELHAAGYFGPAGLDWIVYTEGRKGTESCALVDINARQPMSFVAYSLRNRLACNNQYCIFLFAPRRNYPELTDYASWYRGCGKNAYDPDRATGIILFTPLSYMADRTEYSPLRHGFFISGSTEKEMLAYEHHLRNTFKKD